MRSGRTSRFIVVANCDRVMSHGKIFAAAGILLLAAGSAMCHYKNGPSHSEEKADYKDMIIKKLILKLTEALHSRPVQENAAPPPPLPPPPPSHYLPPPSHHVQQQIPPQQLVKPHHHGPPPQNVIQQGLPPPQMIQQGLPPQQIIQQGLPPQQIIQQGCPPPQQVAPPCIQQLPPPPPPPLPQPPHMHHQHLRPLPPPPPPGLRPSQFQNQPYPSEMCPGCQLEYEEVPCSCCQCGTQYEEIQCPCCQDLQYDEMRCPCCEQKGQFTGRDPLRQRPMPFSEVHQNIVVQQGRGCPPAGVPPSALQRPRLIKPYIPEAFGQASPQIPSRDQCPLPGQPQMMGPPSPQPIQSPQNFVVPGRAPAQPFLPHPLHHSFFTGFSPEEQMSGDIILQKAPFLDAKLRDLLQASNLETC